MLSRQCALAGPISGKLEEELPVNLQFAQLVPLGNCLWLDLLHAQDALLIPISQVLLARVCA
jgi:hypothetical protein